MGRISQYKNGMPDDEEIVNPEEEKTELEQYEEMTEDQIFEDDDFIGDLEEEDE